MKIAIIGAGGVIFAQKLLKDIWGYEPDDSVETIRVHIRHLRSKIDKISNGKKYQIVNFNLVDIDDDFAKVITKPGPFTLV